MDTSQMTRMHGVFNNSNADEIDISTWDVSNVTELCVYSYSFWGKTRKLIGLEKWNVSNVVNMNGLFGGYPLFTDVSGIVDWDVSNCENFSSLFLRHDTIEYIDLSKWRIKDGTTMASCFGVCSRLNTLGLPSIPTGANTTNMFNHCSVLQNIFMREDALIFPTLNFSYCPLSAESVKVILSHLADTPDEGATITFKTGLYSGFSSEEKAEIDALRDSATANGWSIVNMS
jgi:surface protein